MSWNGVNVVRFSNVSGAATNFVMHNPQAMMGQIVKVEYGFRNAAANGSFLLQVSGTNEVIDTVLNITADTQHYPTVNSLVGFGSPYGYMSPAVVGELRIVGSTVGATSGLSYVNVFWR